MTALLGTVSIYTRFFNTIRWEAAQLGETVCSPGSVVHYLVLIIISSSRLLMLLLCVFTVGESLLPGVHCFITFYKFLSALLRGHD